ncbi:MAG TPA: hypothetical protein PLN95_04480 [Candidatus Saccharibacteria bacterium]|nr:hypothetical protein [Candidatus Saccharibacteria bacterium]
MASKRNVAWAYVTVQISVERKVDDDVIDALTDWFGRHYSATQPSARATDRVVDRSLSGMTFLTYTINKRYNAHEVAQKAEKKLNELLRATSS